MLDNFTKEEIKLFRKLNTPSKIQAFINDIPINFELDKIDTCLSPRMVLKQNKAHCTEGAFLAALLLRFHGYEPLIVDLSTTVDDDDHFLAVFKRHGHWGCITKTNHAVLRYREPVYKTIRELVISFFHEYFLSKNGKKTLRSYTKPINLKRFDQDNWMTSEEELWPIVEYIADAPHIPIINRKQIRSLRRADLTEIRFGDILEWKEDGTKY
jgi:hypothetical protein